MATAGAAIASLKGAEETIVAAAVMLPIMAVLPVAAGCVAAAKCELAVVVDTMPVQAVDMRLQRVAAVDMLHQRVAVAADMPHLRVAAAVAVVNMAAVVDGASQ
jgi:hypothetical protein